MQNDNTNNIAPAIAAALLKAPHAADGGSILKASAKELTPGVHYVAGMVEVAGHVSKQPDYEYERSTVNKKAMTAVLHWALQRMTQAEYDCMVRQLDLIMSGEERNHAHGDRLLYVADALMQTTTVRASGKVEWAGTLVIDDLNAFDADEDDVTGHGLTLVGGAS